VIALGADFNTWFKEFCDYGFKDMALTDEALRRYFAGLMMVRKDAFKSNALDVIDIPIFFAWAPTQCLLILVMVLEKSAMHKLLTCKK
jgi:hypothetical protein